MVSLYELYQGWLIFWCSYVCGSLFFPSDKAVSRSAAKITKQKLVKNLFINFMVTGLTIPFISYIPHLIDIPTTTILFCILRYSSLILFAEIWFYYMHRLMHHRYFYRWHKDHHSFIHPHALAGLYCSPVEMILVNQLALSIPFQILGYNYCEMVIFLCLVALNVLKGHSGLEYYLTEDNLKNKILLFLFGNRMHDIHHEYLNVNYGLFYILDPLHGTQRLDCHTNN
jgi:methylsterol monooxygenase